jgi:hypothetical protein
MFAQAILVAALIQAVPASSPSPPATETAPDEPALAARGRGLLLSEAELDPVLVRRFAMTSEGRQALEHLLQTRVLDGMAHERRMQVGPEEVDELVAELDQRVRAAGEPGGIAAQLADNGVDPAEFRELLRIGIVQERLCKEALGIGPDEPVSGDQQEIWIEKEMAARGMEAPEPPWADGVVARCGPVTITEDEYTAMLRHNLPSKSVRDTCYQLLVAKGLRARMPDLSSEAYERAVDLEMARRRKKAEEDPRYRGAPYERLLSMQGLNVARLRVDPAVEVAALAHLWVVKNYDEDRLREVYTEERATFDASLGEAVRARLLFLRAATFTNPMNPRGFTEAEMQLQKLERGIDDEETFEEKARKQSEEPRTRNVGGDVGWLTRSGTGLEELRSAIFADLEVRGPLPPGGRSLGPLRLADGVALLWLGEARPAPSWETMKGHITTELKRRLIDDVLTPDGMITFLDS